MSTWSWEQENISKWVLNSFIPLTQIYTLIEQKVARLVIHSKSLKNEEWPKNWGIEPNKQLAIDN